MARSETIYLGAENRIVRELTRAGQALSAGDKAAITKVQAYIGELCLDTTTSDLISYADGQVTMQWGLVPDGLEPGEHVCRLRVFDAAHATGLAFGEFPVQVVAWPDCGATP